MCDYSLANEKSRIAIEGEELITRRFRSNSIGLVSSNDRERAVCIPPGAALLIENVPVQVCKHFAVPPTDRVVFDQFNIEGNYHRDGVMFSNGERVLLQSLLGARVIVLSLESTEERQPVYEHHWAHVAR